MWCLISEDWVVELVWMLVGFGDFDSGCVYVWELFEIV